MRTAGIACPVVVRRSDLSVPVLAAAECHPHAANFRQVALVDAFDKPARSGMRAEWSLRK